MKNQFKYTKSSLLLKLILLILSITLIFSGCSTSKSIEKNSKDTFITKSSFLLNTVVTINIYDKQDKAILNDCFDLISKYESIYSRTNKDSELYALNNGTAPHDGFTYPISDELNDILKFGLYYGKLSGGSFDITIEPVSSLWDFTAENPKVPDNERIKAALPLVDYQNVTLKDNKVTFAKNGMGFDLGAIAKGYIADRVKELLIKKGVKSAMINLGGNVLCVGNKPDGAPFKVGIQKPFADRNETAAVMKLSDLSVVSSGIYERCFKKNGTLYHHILDPKTGYSFDNDLISVTIISKASVDGDGLSTTCFTLGLEKGLELIDSLPDTYAAFITKDYKIHYSKGFKDHIPTEETME